MADHEDYTDVDPKPVEIHQPVPVESFKVSQANAANLKALVAQLSDARTVFQATEANLKAIVTVNDFERLIDEVKLLRNCNVLATGQSTVRHAGDDGDLKKGVIKSYTILDAGGYAGTTDIVINAKTHALSNNCVKDNNTGLMWARYVPLADIGPAANGTLFWKQWTLAAETVTFTNVDGKITADAGTPFDTNILCAGRKITVSGSGAGNDGTYTVSAITTSVITTVEGVNNEAAIAIDFATVDDLIWDFLAQANANSLGGYTDWRIPNVYELASIVNYGNCNPSIDATTFPSTRPNYHWTGTTLPCNRDHAFLVYFHNGGVSYYEKQQHKDYVRLVRG